MLYIWCSLGTGGPNVRLNNAVSRSVARYGHGARLLCGVWHVDATYFKGELFTNVLSTRSGVIVLIGIGVCLIGIAVAGLAGRLKEKEMSHEEKRATIREFNLRKGILVATFSGIMSACFSYGLAAGQPIKEMTMRYGTPPVWQGLPVLVVVLLGGFTTNFIWCVSLNVRNSSGSEYFRSKARPNPDGMRTPMLRNYVLCAVAGVTWYLQFFFYSIGESRMGVYKFSSWTIHMASIIIFSTLWGRACTNGEARETYDAPAVPEH